MRRRPVALEQLCRVDGVRSRRNREPCLPVAGDERLRARDTACAPSTSAAASRGVGASVVADPGRYLAFLGLYDLLFALLCWAAFEFVVTE